MKKIGLILILPLLFLACSGSKKTTYSDSGYVDNIPDSLANYYLFEYAETLDQELYAKLLEQIKQENSDDFFTLRMAYTQTEDYSPYNFTARTMLSEIRQLLDNSEYSSAIDRLEGILDDDFTNISAHLYMGYAYSELNDSTASNYHYKMYEGLLYSIYDSGDGRHPETAYIVINTTEEYAFLNWFALNFQEQSLIHHEGYSFDLMKALDPETKETHHIYFNVSLAFQKLVD